MEAANDVVTRIICGIALFYTRDSGGYHEMTPSQYLSWACRTANERGLLFDGTPNSIDEMIREDRYVQGDVFLDYGVKGNTFDRKGLQALRDRVKRDSQVSHLLIPRRDRLARPDDAIDAMAVENEIRRDGVTILFMNQELGPLQKGRRANLVESLTGLIEYDQSGKDRQTLADKIIRAQIALARQGLSTGGRAPYGFKRCLVKGDGVVVRDLADGERVRMAGHHVAWIPDDGDRLATALRIRHLLKTMPASRIAALLTEDGVPAPDSGRARKDNGVSHPVSGVWHQTTVVSIGRNPLLAAITTYGQRSMGDQLRFSPDGPRELDDSDFRAVSDSGDSKPKVIQNPVDSQITASAKFNPVVSVDEHLKLNAILDARSSTQRGKPRSRDPRKNPLGGRVFDVNCGWPLYREPYNGSFRYKCGLYQQSHGQKCAHNHVNGQTATAFLLSCIQQRLLSPDVLHAVERRLGELTTSPSDRQSDQLLESLRKKMTSIEADRKHAQSNLARARTDQQYEAISAEFEQICAREEGLKREIAEAEVRVSRPGDLQTAVEGAMKVAHRIRDLAAETPTLDTARKLFELTNAKLFVRFEPRKVKGRTLNKVSGGWVTFGETPAPISLYEGATTRKKVKGVESSTPSKGKTNVSPGEEEGSLGNVSRGDWI